MTFKDIARELNINYAGELGRNNSYVMDLFSADDFRDSFSELSRNRDVIQLQENNLLNTHSASILYLYKDRYQINLKADFDSDEYSIIITDLGEDNE